MTLSKTSFPIEATEEGDILEVTSSISKLNFLMINIKNN